MSFGHGTLTPGLADGNIQTVQFNISFKATFTTPTFLSAMTKAQWKTTAYAARDLAPAVTICQVVFFLWITFPNMSTQGFFNHPTMKETPQSSHSHLNWSWQSSARQKSADGTCTLSLIFWISNQISATRSVLHPHF